MTGCKNTSVYNGNQKIASPVVSSAKSRNQGNRYNIDNSNGNHRADGTECVNLSPLLYILRHGATQGSVWNINAGIA